MNAPLLRRAAVAAAGTLSAMLGVVFLVLVVIMAAERAAPGEAEFVLIAIALTFVALWVGFYKTWSRSGD